jgi:hypothetical protein
MMNVCDQLPLCGPSRLAQTATTMNKDDQCKCDQESGVVVLAKEFLHVVMKRVMESARNAAMCSCTWISALHLLLCASDYYI